MFFLRSGRPRLKLVGGDGMKKETVTFTYDAEKLAALKMYMAQKNIRLEDELEKTAEGVYNKTVPSNVRDYIAMKNNLKK